MFVSYGLNAASQFVSVYESQNKLNSLSYFGGFIDWPCKGRRKLTKKNKIDKSVSMGLKAHQLVLIKPCPLITLN